MNVSEESSDQIIAAVLQWGPWGAFVLVFMIFGMPHIAGIITAIGTIFNERHKTNLSHKRSMSKIENQIRDSGIGKTGKK